MLRAVSERSSGWSLEDHLPGFRLRKQQQRPHDLREPLHIAEGNNNGVAILLRRLRGEKRHFELSADNRDGRPQFVRNIGRKLPYLDEVLLETQIIGLNVSIRYSSSSSLFAPESSD